MNAAGLEGYLFQRRLTWLLRGQWFGVKEDPGLGVVQKELGTSGRAGVVSTGWVGGEVSRLGSRRARRF